MQLYRSLLCLLLIFLSCCESNEPVIRTHVDVQRGVNTMQSISIVSSAFEDGGTIPKKYTCEGADISPALKWSNIPDGAKTLVLICDDPDAPTGTWVHWIVFNIPADATSFPEAVDVENQFGAVVGTNSWGRQNYGGPCPPSGTHRYFFKLYALDRTLTLDKRATKESLEKAMEGAILAHGQIMGRYERLQQ